MDEGANKPNEGQVGLVFFKYIDDTTTVETVNMDKATRHIQAAGPCEDVPAQLTKEALVGISRKAADIGMKVNGKKTQLLCISADNGYSSSTTIQAVG